MRALVAIVSEYPWGTGESFFQDELAALAARFDRVLVVATAPRAAASGPPRSVPADVTTLHLPTSRPLVRNLPGVLLELPAGLRGDLRGLRGWASLRVFLAFLARARAFRRDLLPVLDSLGADQLVLYSYWLTEHAYALSRIRATRKGVRAYARAHNWDVYPERHTPAYLPLRRALLTGLDGLFAVSAHGARRIQALAGPGTPPVHVRLLGTRPGTFRSVEARPGRLRILSLSAVSPVKNLDLLVAALADLPELDVEWHHAGDAGPPGTALRARAVSLLGSGRASFHGWLPSADVSALLAATDFDVLVNCSSFEGMPVSAMEAMAHGIPVIAPAVGGFPEMVVDGVNGLLMPAPATAPALRAALRRLGAQAARERAAMRRAALDTWARLFDARVNFAAFAEELARDR